MKTDKQMAEEILNEVSIKKAAISKRNKIVASAAAVAVVLVGAAVIGKGGNELFSGGGLLHKQSNTIEAGKIASEKESLTQGETSSSFIPAGEYWTNEESYSEKEKTENNVTESFSAQTKAAKTEAEKTEAKDEGGSVKSGGYGGEVITGSDEPKTFSFHYEGENLTDAEGNEYFKTHGEGIKNALTSSGVKLDEITFSPRGYGHINYDGQGNITLRRNFRDFVVYGKDGKVVAIITLVKENGQIYDNVAFGGPWFGNYGQLLKTYKGKELVYVYCGQTEYIFTPDGKIINPLGYEPGNEFNGISDPYKTFKYPENTFTP